MDLSKIKNFVKKNGDKFIVIENDEPEIVVMSFQEYVKLVDDKIDSRDKATTIVKSTRDTKAQEETKATTGNGGDSLTETEFVTPVAFESAAFPVRLEDIRLEDLPF